MMNSTRRPLTRRKTDFFNFYTLSSRCKNQLRPPRFIATGSELLTPDRADTNSLFITERLNSIGIEVKLKTIVGDDDARMEEAIGDALRRSEIVITTGGLGPTEDDVTRKSVARALKLRLVLNDEVLAGIRAKFQRMNRQMPEINSRQAMIVETAQVLDNPNGSAPGMLIERGERVVVCLPGPPREMRPMFDRLVMPNLTPRAGGVRVRRRLMRVAGMGESAIDERIAPVYKQFTNPQTTILFNKHEIEIHLTAQAATDAEAELLLDGLAGQIEDRSAMRFSLFAARRWKRSSAYDSPRKASPSPSPKAARADSSANASRKFPAHPHTSWKAS
jgi:nicotinamide-nucleotide amidase